MKCHYEILGVSKDVSDDDLKKAYRKLALKWHPDKNPDDPHKAKEQFQLVQQAWEVLSDPHERAWYDNHREAILKGGTEEYSVDIFQYFSATCFKGYGDDEKGFYTVYRNVFDNIAAEDAEFARESKFNEEIPSFGNCQSSYEEIVHNFYSYWQSYSTKRSFSWLEPYDTHDAPNRRVSRLIEKENRKVCDKAKRERNEQVRNLVAFVRKRDKRVHAHAAKLAERNRENYRKAEERKKAQLLERQKLLREHKESEWFKLSNMEAELKNIEANLAEEFGEELSSDSDTKSDNQVDDNTLYCIACNKIFKTHKAFTNHENSKKHKDNIITLKAAMVKDDEDFRDSSEESQASESPPINEQPNLATDSQMPDFLLNPPWNNVAKCVDNESNGDTSDDELISDTEENSRHPRSRSKKKKLDKKNISLAIDSQMDEDIPLSVETENKNDDITSEDELISDQEEEISLDRQKKKKKRKRNIQNPNPVFEHVNDNETESINEETGLSKKQRKKLQQKKAAMSKYNKDTYDEEKHEIKDENETTELMADNTESTSAVSSLGIFGATANENIKTNKSKKGRRKEAEDKEKNKKDLIADTDNSSICCVSCKTEFPSKNKLFEHLKKTGHAVYMPETSKSKKNQDKTQKGKTNSEKKKR